MKEQKLTKEKFIEKFNKSNNLRKIKLELLNPEIIEEFVLSKSLNNGKVNKNLNIEFKFKCENGHEDSMTVYSRLLDSKYSCKYCAIEDRRLIRLKKLKNKLKELYKEFNYIFPYIDIEYIDTSSYITGICPKHGEFKQTVGFLTSSSLSRRQHCKYCKSDNREYIVPDNYKKIFAEMQIEYINKPISSNEKQHLKCLLCNNKFYASPKSKVTNYKKHGIKGCPKCTLKTRLIEQRQFSIKLLEKYYIFLDNYNDININKHTPMRVKNKKCNHEFVASYNTLRNSNDDSCPICNMNNYNKNNILHKLKHKEDYEVYKKKVQGLTEINYRANKQKINPDNLNRSYANNDEGYHLDHILSKRYCYDMNIPAEICAHPDNLRIISGKENLFKSGKVHLIDEIPDIFNIYLTDNYKLVNNFINEISELCDNPIINYVDDKFKLHIYDNDNFGIVFANYNEYSTKIFRSKYYFKELIEYFENKNINVIIVTEQEWVHSHDKVINKIKYKLGLGDIIKIHGRRCEIKEVKTKDIREFLRSNHIQNESPSRYAFGAYYNNELVAVMTFIPKRSGILGRKKTSIYHEYELIRFAVKQGYHVNGIASKLLKRFLNYITDIHPTGPIKITTYSDNRWSKGNLYNVIGFNFKTNNEPSYYYIENNIAYSRARFQKHKIKERFPEEYDDSMTEEMLMNIIGIKYNIDKMYDAGSKTYEYILE